MATTLGKRQSPRDEVSSPRDSPIFVLGITPRCGTNFLYRLLCEHPDCGGVGHSIREDHMLHRVDRLAAYIGKLHWHWAHWEDDAELIDALTRHLGMGLAAFLSSLTEARRAVTKTPRVENAARVFDFFPDAQVILLVRDGRSVVASGMEGFGWNFEDAARTWADAARTVRAFQRTHGDQAGKKYLIVKYEDLNADTSGEIRRILDFLALDPDRYDFDTAEHLPVYGSSFNKENENVNWQPKPKPQSFDGNRRWRDWDDSRHRRFNWIAGRELEALDYEPVAVSSSSFAQVGYNMSSDLLYHTKRLPCRLRRSGKEAVKAFLHTMRGR